MSSSELAVYDRQTCEYKNLSEKFKVKSDEYHKQFAHIYTLRLKKMRPNLIECAKKKWGNDIPILQLFQLQEEAEVEEPRQCVLTGTLYKQQVLKPNIVKEISEEHQLDAQPLKKHYCDDSDDLVLEDEQQRISLLGNIDVHSLLTGIVCAILGQDDKNGKFLVEDFCFYEPKEHVYKPISQPDRLIVLISGLGLAGERAGDSLLNTELFTEWLCGEAGNSKDQRQASNIVRLIIAGNSLQECAQDRLVSRKLHTIESETQTILSKGMELLDNFLVQLLESVDVDIMPGEFDPGNHMLPQQPLHRCLLPQSFHFPTMHSVSNPYQCEVGGRIILGTSGQTINDIFTLCRQSNRLRLLESCLEWAHISPTSPDTLPCFPCYTDDPFIIESCPDIFFAGNQPEFQTKLVAAKEGQAVRLVCVPSFSKTGTCAVVNLNTLDCHPLKFGSDFIAEI